mgnify:CR=1 FL=1
MIQCTGSPSGYIVTKKSLISNWQREVSEHTSLTARKLGIDRRQNFYSFHKPTALYVAHYEASSSFGLGGYLSLWDSLNKKCENFNNHDFKKLVLIV